MAAIQTMDTDNCWDDDFAGDLHGFGNSAGTAQTSISSRLSIHSESIAGDEDWNVVLPSNDEQATTRAVQSAKQAGIPLPQNVPASALLGGTIKRLGKKPSKQKVEDDWDNDMDLGNAPLTLKPRAPEIKMTDDDLDFDDFEGSLGIRIAGKSKDTRDSSISAFSPSMGSVTAESELDDMVGLELPEGPMDFDAMLKKRRAAEAELSDLSQASPAMEQTATMKTHKKSKLAEDNDDFFSDFELGGGEVLDVQKRTINKNIRLKSAKPLTPVNRPQTTINFHDKPTDKPLHSRSHLPRPVSGTRPGHMRLESVPEKIESFIAPAPFGRDRRPTTTTSAQLLRSKRSLPVLSSNARAGVASSRPTAFQPSTTNYQPSHASAQRAMPYHLRRDSDTNRQGAQSPPARPHSRLSNLYVPETPSRTKNRADQAPAALAREAAVKRTVTKPNRRRQFGDGSELEVFDDLPTSQQKEAKFVKQPVARGPPKLGLRQAQSAKDVREIAKRTGMVTPAPRTPASPTRGFYEAQQYTPSYLRDTAASRIARESTQSRLAANPRPRSEGPLQPLTTNWKAQVAARSPQASPSSQKNRLRRVPQLIRGNGAHVPKAEKGMIYNPNTLRWEGNENTLSRFELPPALETPTPMGPEGTSYMERSPMLGGSPPRPALIAPMSAATNLQVNGHMVFDPHQMKWLKLKSGRDVSGPLSPSATDDDEDPFAGIVDLEDKPPATNISVSGLASPLSVAAPGVGEMHEEFDLGPQFIRLQKEEEAMWRKRCEMWFPGGEARADDGRWRWSIRDIASPEPL